MTESLHHGTAQTHWYNESETILARRWPDTGNALSNKLC